MVRLELLVALCAALAALSCGPAPLADDESTLAKARDRMVAEQIEARGGKDPLALGALRTEPAGASSPLLRGPRRTVPRHEFVPPAARLDAYGDHPLPIGHGQTVS